MIHVFRVGLRGLQRQTRDRGADTRAKAAIAPLLESLRPTVAECATCADFYQPLGAGHGRCTHPHRGCPSCATRTDPWTRAKTCPLKTASMPPAPPVQG